MIRGEIEGIDTSNYIYETNLTFGIDFGKKLLDMVIESDEFLILRKKYIDPRKQLTDLKTHPDLVNDPVKAKWFLQRCLQLKTKNAGKKNIDFKQYYMPADLTKEFYDIVPDWLKGIVPAENYTPNVSVPDWMREIIPSEPLPGVQISQHGDLLPVHRGHPRRSSLFMLLQGNNEETRWHRETSPFEVFDHCRIPDLDKIEHVVTAELEPFKWYVFNHREWHSVHRFSSGKRISIGIDFDSISVPELIKLVEEHKND